MSAALPTPRPERAKPLLSKRTRAGLALAAAVALTAWIAIEPPITSHAPDEPPPPVDGMVFVRRAEVRLGEGEVEARRLFAECRAEYGDVCGREPFESSAFAREVQAPGASPIRIASFYLDKTEVTASDFARFLNDEQPKLRVERRGSKAWVVDESGKPLAALATEADVAADAETRSAIGFREGDAGFVLDERRANAPVTLVSWHGARRFCEARHKRLPTEEEWELAARGTKRRRFPWGESPPARCSEVAFAEEPGGACEREARGARAVGTSPGDVTPDGIFDLGGNVAEWTSSAFAGGEAGSPCEPGSCRVVRGGSFADPGPLLRSALRWRQRDGGFWLNIGFRCARDGEVES